MRLAPAVVVAVAVAAASSGARAADAPQPEAAPAPPPADAPPAAAPPAAAPSPDACPARDVWPAPDWPSRADDVRKERAAEIAALEKYAFTLEGKDADRKGVRTDALLIVQGGAVVYERYARGFTALKRHLAWSASKSLTHALTGVAVRDGLLSTSDSICKSLKDLPATSCAITVDDLLEMASGLDWKEVYENQSNQESSVLAMLYGQGYGDMGGFNARHALREPPGTSWMYSSGDTNTLADVLGAVMLKKFGPLYPWPALFDRIGARRVAFERDGSGAFVGASYWYASARDAARLGYLYLNDGCWKGARLLPAGWVKDATTVSPAFKNKRIDADPDDVYGKLWWLNKAVPEAGIKQPYPDVPDDFFAAQGHWGQSINVIPSLDLVIVRFADDRDHSLDKNELLKLAIAVGRP